MVEEIDVESSLNDTGNDGDEVSVVVGFGLCTVDPVGNVESTVQAKHEDVIAGQVLNLAVTLKHNQLREDGQRLEVDGKCPQNLHRQPKKLRYSGG
jgi:hypothetical protein